MSDQLLCRVAELEAKLEDLKKLNHLLITQTEDALGVIEQYGGFDGSHHKQWVLDQVARKLTGDAYDDWVKMMLGEYDEEEEMYEYEWDEGIPP